ncbi:MarR family winged helix-turn-helix transcriptional regulator [Cypionkella sinensis]|uniref:MarR family winged helix-turn-helix transcriptional regulator n=1 Tax=Cypionkella sinensis TaxID=1756043 RepID=A0ABV7IVH5_9RHOB
MSDNEIRMVEAIPEAGRLVTKALGEVLRPFQLTVAQLEVLELLWRQGEVSQKAIIETRGVEAATVGTTLTRLERDGWIVRHADPVDGRGRIAKPSEKAIAAKDGIRAAVEQLEMKLRFADISEESLSAMVKNLRQL